VPIVVDGKYWGVVVWTTAERQNAAVTQRACRSQNSSGSIGSAIQRDRIRRAREQWLEATAASAGSCPMQTQMRD